MSTTRDPVDDSNGEAINRRPSAIRAAAENAGAAWRRDELAFAWRRAQDDAVGAYRAWCETPGVAAYAAYRAAQDRADQAQDVLAANVLAR